MSKVRKVLEFSEHLLLKLTLHCQLGQLEAETLPKSNFNLFFGHIVLQEKSFIFIELCTIRVACWENLPIKYIFSHVTMGPLSHIFKS